MDKTKTSPKGTKVATRPVSIGTYKNQGKMPATISPATGPKPTNTSKKK